MNKVNHEIRCNKCGKLLGRIKISTDGLIEMKCPKCKTVDTYKLND